jgi:hypothetical protein
MESSYGETASVEHIVRDSGVHQDRFLCSQTTELVVEGRSIARVFNDRANVELDSAV